MTIRHLEIFTAVVEEKGMSAAAKKLHISQPTVSQAIAELEKHYGVKLFERLTQKLYLTKEGELLLSFSRHILDSFGQMEEAMTLAAGSTNLQIGCSVSVGTCLINDILDEAKERMPDCSIQVLVANTSDIEKAVLENEVDFGIVEGMIQSEDLLVTPVFKDELVLVCEKNHPLAKENIVTMQMLEGQDYISRESGSTERNQMEKRFEEEGLHLKRTFCSTNTEAIKNAVMRGRGIAVLSKRIVQKEIDEGNMKVLPLDIPPVTRNISFVIHKNKFVSESIRNMMKVLRMKEER